MMLTKIKGDIAFSANKTMTLIMMILFASILRVFYHFIIVYMHGGLMMPLRRLPFAPRRLPCVILDAFAQKCRLARQAGAVLAAAYVRRRALLYSLRLIFTISVGI